MKIGLFTQLVYNGNVDLKNRLQNMLDSTTDVDMYICLGDFVTGTQPEVIARATEIKNMLVATGKPHYFIVGNSHGSATVEDVLTAVGQPNENLFVPFMGYNLLLMAKYNYENLFSDSDFNWYIDKLQNGAGPIIVFEQDPIQFCITPSQRNNMIEAYKNTPNVILEIGGGFARDLENWNSKYNYFVPPLREDSAYTVLTTTTSGGTFTGTNTFNHSYTLENYWVHTPVLKGLWDKADLAFAVLPACCPDGEVTVYTGNSTNVRANTSSLNIQNGVIQFEGDKALTFENYIFPSMANSSEWTIEIKLKFEDFYNETNYAEILTCLNNTFDNGTLFVLGEYNPDFSLNNYMTMFMVGNGAAFFPGFNAYENFSLLGEHTIHIIKKGVLVWFYFDGKIYYYYPDANNDFSVLDYSSLSFLQFGRFQEPDPYPSYPFIGKLRSFVIYNRALTQEECNDNINLGYDYGNLRALNNGDGTIQLYVNPTITTQPSSRTVNERTSTTFSVTPAGDGPFTYQWKKNGNSISGATSQTYTITSVREGDQGNYSVRVTNIVGHVDSNNASLIVNSLPFITLQPEGVTVLSGAYVTFNIEVDPGIDPPFTYQWYKDSLILSGATGTSLIVGPCEEGITDGNYYVEISNSHGTTTSDTAILIVNAKTDGGTSGTMITPNGETYTEVITWRLDSTTLLPVGVQSTYNF